MALLSLIAFLGSSDRRAAKYLRGRSYFPNLFDYADGRWVVALSVLLYDAGSSFV